MKQKLSTSGVHSFVKNYVLTFALLLIGVCSIQSVSAQESIVVEITSPEQASTQYKGYEITISANASADPGIERVNFKVNDQQIKSDPTQPYATTWTPTEVGTYRITAVAVDNESFRKTSEEIVITVIEATDVEQLPYTDENLPHAVPGRIDFEHYDNGGKNIAYWDKTDVNASEFRSDETVDISTDGTKVRDIKENEWLEYTIEIPETGDYDVLVNHQTRRSPAYEQLTVSFFDEGIEFISKKMLTNTGSSAYMTEKIGTVNMEAGVHVLRFHSLSYGYDLDYFVLNKAGASYTVTFNDGVGTSTATTDENLNVVLPEDPTQEEKVFQYWATSDGEVFDENSVVTSNMEVIAVYTAKTYAVNIISETGTVTISPEQDGYELNTEITLTATADDLYEFSSWSGDATGTENPITITVTGELNITAHYETSVQLYDVTFNDGENTVVVTTYADGTCKLPDTPVHQDKIFQHWEMSNGDIFDETTVVTENIEVNAVWEVKKFTVTVVAENGSVNISPEFIVHESGSEITLTATASSGYEFTSWSGDYEGTENPLTMTIRQNMNITANFITSTVASVNQLDMVSKVYPNPSNGVVNVEFASSDQVTYKVVSLNGALLKEGVFTNKVSIDLSDQTPGLYLIELQTKDGFVTKKVLIK
ncbi:InlB B-repeat-containing protein [Flammeovirga yaeyamensis]|uniref:InlB B-repeat-containing protein n=1 Tax=Flammeovirga yaeyamensis TaxID=367791 RepID=A0AAX1NCU6_9BACT|nr:InlB B-repeat-containing protein [Flammeovirga yaeyamensis]MBB3696624.1 hypothetical protein [Flammeovirga yaeyamensis]NMF33297.1 T9SS type A sorting domain-containing protein [Flammeovirga yaeyamensis]QWG05424.1 InlB B-repeat-containing protein [Flammeovirga yaeyamensis]